MVGERLTLMIDMDVLGRYCSSVVVYIFLKVLLHLEYLLSCTLECSLRCTTSPPGSTVRKDALYASRIKVF